MTDEGCSSTRDANAARDHALSPFTSRTQLVLNVSLTVLFPDAISETVLLSMVFNAVLLGSKVPQLLKLRDIGKQMAALEAELERKTVALKSVQERRSSTA